MPSARVIALVAYPGAASLDITGPAAVFAATNRLVGRDVYATRVLSSTGGLIATDGDVAIMTRPLRQLKPARVHTMLVVGGDEPALRAMLLDAVARRWIVRTARVCARFGSVCSGAFVLASYGLLDGKRVATHWEATAILQKTFPKLSVDADALYVEDGRVWTSAGVTTGIDMALALVQRDVSAAAATAVAQRLVLHARRPGFQSQFSPLLHAQLRADTPYRDLIEWLQQHLRDRLDLAALAARAGQSPRHFHRRFSVVTGESPAHFVETLRLERARALLAHRVTLKEVADESGFGSAVQFSRAFERRFGLPPSVLRQTLSAVCP
jgi:transcriptional regulator GlxA family with amidase domain